MFITGAACCMPNRGHSNVGEAALSITRGRATKKLTLIPQLALAREIVGCSDEPKSPLDWLACIRECSDDVLAAHRVEVLIAQRPVSIAAVASHLGSIGDVKLRAAAATHAWECCVRDAIFWDGNASDIGNALLVARMMKANSGSVSDVGSKSSVLDEYTNALLCRGEIEQAAVAALTLRLRVSGVLSLFGLFNETSVEKLLDTTCGECNSRGGWHTCAANAALRAFDDPCENG